MTDIKERLTRINESTATQISTRVGLSMHPDSLLPVSGALVTGNADAAEHIYTSGRAALAALYSGLEKIESAHHETGQTRMVGKTAVREIPPDKKPALADAMGKCFETTANAVKRHEETVNKHIESLELQISTALSNPRKNETAIATAASEIRGTVRAIAKPADRVVAVQKAIADGDIVAVAAILETSPRASGLTLEQQNQLRREAQVKFAATATAQHAAAIKVKQSIESSTARFVGRFAELLPKIQATAEANALKRLRG